MNPSTNKSVIITGAGSGIGEATAIEFSKQGYTCVLLGRSLDKLKAVQLKAKNSLVYTCDLKDSKNVKDTVAQIISRPELKIEVLVNCAGIYARSLFEESSDEFWKEQFEVNLFGAVRITRELFPYFKKNKKGSIVQVSSTLGLNPVAETAAYSASKAALNNLTQTLALEGAPWGIRVNSVSPGIIDTPMHAFHHLIGKQKEETLQAMKNLQPLGRIGTPEEIANSIYFLGSDLSSWTTGANLTVDGGINL